MTLRRWHPADTPHKTAHGEADHEPTHAWSIRVSPTSRGPTCAHRVAARTTDGDISGRHRACRVTLLGRHRDKEQAQILTSAPSP